MVIVFVLSEMRVAGMHTAGSHALKKKKKKGHKITAFGLLIHKANVHHAQVKGVPNHSGVQASLCW